MPLQNLLAEFAESLAEEKAWEEVSPSRNIIIHKNNIAASLQHALQDTYPLVCKLVGEAFFRVTAKEYIKQYPSRSSNLHDYGEYFSDFIGEYQPLKDLIYLTEVAKFEWLCHSLFFSADHPGLDLARLQIVSPQQYDQIQLILHPASRLMKCHYPLLQMIDLCKNNREETIDLEAGGVYLFLLRRHLDVSLIELTQAEYTFLSMIDQGNLLIEATNAAIALDQHFNLEAKLSRFIADKFIVDFKVV